MPMHKEKRRSILGTIDIYGWKTMSGPIHETNLSLLSDLSEVSPDKEKSYAV